MYCLVYRSWVVRERKDSATCCGLGDGRCKGLIVHGHLEPYSPATDPERASLAIRQQVLICQTPPIQSRPHRSPCSRRAGSPRPCPILAWMLLPLIRRLRGNAPRTWLVTPRFLRPSPARHGPRPVPHLCPPDGSASGRAVPSWGSGRGRVRSKTSACVRACESVSRRRQVGQYVPAVRVLSSAVVCPPALRDRLAHALDTYAIIQYLPRAGWGVAAARPPAADLQAHRLVSIASVDKLSVLRHRHPGSRPEASSPNAQAPEWEAAGGGKPLRGVMQVFCCPCAALRPRAAGRGRKGGGPVPGIAMSQCWVRATGHDIRPPFFG